jgi:putative ABC transport system permease protein
MVRAALRQAIADARHRWFQTSLVFIVIVAAATVGMLAITVWSSASKPYERALEKANGPHAWFFGGRTDLTQIAHQDEVAGVAGPYAVSFNFSVDVGRERHAVRFWATGAELPETKPALLTDGRWLSPDGENEVVIGGGFAKETGFRVGDEIVVSNETGRTTLNIVGIAANFERAPYPAFGPAVFHVLPETFDRLTKNDINAWILGVRLENAGDSERFIEDVHAQYPGPYTRSWQEVRVHINDLNTANLIFLTVFSVFALLAVGFIIANTIGGQVLAKFREIGLLKAVGFTPGGVTSLLLLENLMLAVPGAVIGSALGLVLSPLFLGPVATVFDESPVPPFDPVVALEVIGGIAFITMVFTALPAWQAGRVSTVRAVTTGVMAEDSRPSIPGRVATALRLPPLLVIAIKDSFSKPLRAALTVGALTLAVMTVTFALAVDATLVAAKNDPGLVGGEPFELGVDPRELSNDETEALIKARPEVDGYVKRAWFEIAIPGRYENLNTLGLSGDYEKIGYPIADGRMFSGPDEAAVGLGLARRLDLDVGDTVTFLLWGETKLELPVVGTYVEDRDQGKTIMFDLATVKEIEPNPKFVDFGVKLVPGTDAEAVRQSLEQAAGGGIEVDNVARDWQDSIQDSRRESRTVLYSLNGVLLAIAAVNLLATLLLTVRERQRDVGIMKSIGMTPVQVVSAFVMGSVAFALVAAVIGIPAGTFLTGVLFNLAAWQEGWTQGIGQTPGIGWLALTALVAVAVAVIGSARPALQAGRSPIIDALRYE